MLLSVSTADSETVYGQSMSPLWIHLIYYVEIMVQGTDPVVTITVLLSSGSSVNISVMCMKKHCVG